MITAAQCRAARALLKWNQRELAARANIGVSTIRTFETNVTTPYQTTLGILKETFEKAGIEFIDDDGLGVKLKG